MTCMIKATDPVLEAASHAAEVTAYPPRGVQELVGRTELCMSAEEKEGEARG